MIAATTMARWIEDLAQFGQIPETGGMWRRPYTVEESQAIAWVSDRCREFGLTLRRDAIGNLIARAEGKDPSAKVVSTGSHLDSVKNGGKYDGPLGVLSGLAAIANCLAQRGQPDKPLELIVWVGEEGNRYSPGLLGSRAMVNELTEADFDAMVDVDGVRASDAMRAVGLDPSQLPVRQRTDLGAYIELHIEQGSRLERAGINVAFVSAIVSSRQLKLVWHGEPGHAGTTPMADRKDALQGACEFTLAATKLVEAVGAPAVLTCGILNVFPGAPNVIPGRVEQTIGTRDADPHRVADTANRVAALAREIGERRGLRLDLEISSHGLGPGPMDRGLIGVLQAAAGAAGITHTELYSGAGHDAGAIARICPAAMLFVPSVNGYSHRPDEYTKIEDVMNGVAVLTGALARLAYAGPA